MKSSMLVVAAALVLISASAWGNPLAITLTPDANNPVSPQMGDHLRFHTTVHNDGETAVDGLIAWISLVRIDEGKEQPVDLEDWSAQKAVTAANLAPGQTVEADWPMRLIQAGRYRVVVSAVSRESTALSASPFADFTVRRKSVVESQRILPVAFGVPLLLGGLMLWRHRRVST